MRLPGCLAVLFVSSAVSLPAQAPRWDPSVKDCDRACLIGVLDRYLSAIFARDTKAVPTLAPDVRMTENTGTMRVGEGLLWRARTEPTSFKVYVADPSGGQVALQTRLRVQGRDTLVAIRLRVDGGAILEIEHLYLGNVAPQAIELLTTPAAILTSDIPAAQRASRQTMLRVANSYFDALESDSGAVAAFAKGCVRHENGYRTVNNPPPGGRLMPGPALPDPKTEAGQLQLKQSMLTCAEQIDTKLFAFITRIRPRRALIVDEQKGLVAAFPMFVLDGTRRGAPDAPPGLLQNMVTMETFAIRDGLIQHVEVFPFVSIPFGLGDGWTPGSGH